MPKHPGQIYPSAFPFQHLEGNTRSIIDEGKASIFNFATLFNFNFFRRDTIIQRQVFLTLTFNCHCHFHCLLHVAAVSSRRGLCVRRAGLPRDEFDDVRCRSRQLCVGCYLGTPLMSLISASSLF